MQENDVTMEAATVIAAILAILILGGAGLLTGLFILMPLGITNFWIAWIIGIILAGQVLGTAAKLLRHSFNRDELFEIVNDIAEREKRKNDDTYFDEE